jgi:predicted RNA binding protein YcfA (HicA-like mRNA interferase family)
MTELRRALKRAGFVITKTRGGHWRIEHPNMAGPVFAPNTPSEHRGLKNLEALLRRKLRAANDNEAPAHRQLRGATVNKAPRRRKQRGENEDNP